MAAPSIVIDGQQPYGTPLVTIGGNVYKLNNIKIDRPVDEAMRRNQLGKPTDQRFTAGVATLTAEAQYPSTGTTVPVFGETFTATVDPAYGSETWIVQPQSYDADNSEGSIRIFNLVAKKALNPGDITTVA